LAQSPTVIPVILCGGAGTRLWPASRPTRPKQFLPLLGARSLFQDTVLRMGRLKGAAEAVVVTGQAHLEAIRRQLEEIGAEAFVIVEPEGRDSAPAMAAAASWIAERHPGAIAVCVASDHHIPDVDAFCAAAEIAVAAALAGAIATFGVRPSHASTAYGYLEPGEPLDIPGARKLERFVEKPNAETAAGYLEAGYLWNSGNFVFAAETLLEELQSYAPAVAEKARAAHAAGRIQAGVLALGLDFLASPKISIDYAVMEKTGHAAVVPVDYAWSDLGSWQAIHEAAARDEGGNSVMGQVRLRSSRDVLVRSSTDQLVTVLGLEQVGVVVEADAILVCHLGSSQDVKALVDGLAPAAPAEDPELARTGQALRDWLLAAALPIWWALGADRQGGGFVEALDPTGRPAERFRRVRVQARMAYVYAASAALGWRGPWRQAIDHALACLEARYRRPDGLYRTLATPDGRPLEEAALLYDQAFVLIALAAAARAMPERRRALEAKAGSLLDLILAGFRNQAGGFVERDHRRSPPRYGLTEEGAYQCNAQMHLFEAALGWRQVGEDARWAVVADEIGDLCCSSFVDAQTGALTELFDADWRAAEGDAGRVLDPGHHFEWAWLLEQWSWVSGRPEGARVAERLFAAGERGVDRVRGAVMDSLDADFSARERTARLWPQTERLKAAHLLARRARPEAMQPYLEAAREAAQTLVGYLEVPLPGLWRDRLGPDGRFADGPAPGSSLYHIVAAVAEVSGIRIAPAPDARKAPCAS
jgi:mannose-1-phosphate guanylyltransferase/mannose-6-phosphate isomerase